MVRYSSTSTGVRRAWAYGFSLLAVCLLSACGGGTSAPYAGPAVPANGGTGAGGGGGGGGLTGAATPFSLFASTYVAYAGATSPPFLHSVQGGDIFTGFNGSFAYGGYSSAQADMNRTGFYTLQGQNSQASASTAANNYFYVAFLAPGDGTFDISQANTLLIQMGNAFVPSGGIPTGPNANVFTVDLNNTVGSTPATNDCSTDVTLASVGVNTATSALGVRTYAVPLDSAHFSCKNGSTVAGLLQGGITTVAVTVAGNKNTALVANEGDTISVGMIGFTNTVPATSQSQLGL